MKATKKQAIWQIDQRDFEHVFSPPQKDDKRRNCLFCKKNIKGGEQYFKHYEYTYQPNQLRWNACEKCFYKIYARKKRKN